MMTPERFEALLHSHGADPRRWPEAERAAAERLLQQARPELQQALHDAAALDGLLNAYTLPDASAALQRRIVASAPPQARRPWWWAGAGAAALGLAGCMAGALAVAAVLRSLPVPVPATDWLQRGTGFSTGPADGSEE